jgi:hypothetical protein
MLMDVAEKGGEIRYFLRLAAIKGSVVATIELLARLIEPRTLRQAEPGKMALFWQG